MSPEQAKVLERAQATVQHSLSLLHVTHRTYVDAAAARHVTAQIRRRAFVLYIGGGAEADGVTAPALIREKLARGALPRFPATKVLYKRGQTKTREACGLPIDRHHVEVDAVFDLSHAIVGMCVTLSFHAECFDAWQKEMRTSVA